jgi:hypothetical protein
MDTSPSIPQPASPIDAPTDAPEDPHKQTSKFSDSELLTYQEDNTQPSASDTQPSTTDSPLKNLPYDDNTTPLVTLLPSPYLASEPCTTIPQT